MERWEVNQSDRVGVMPAICAARCPHEEVVKLLSKQKYIDPDAQTKRIVKKRSPSLLKMGKREH